MTPNVAACRDCGDEVDPSVGGTWREVTGWVQSRKGGGAHGVRWQEATGAYLCRWCADLRNKGIHRGQGSML